ncbi:MAG TPA: glycosyltransferase family 4 protein [Pyrinomonadaceae bacterium]|jgi:glycosyltransferase involved in cell wall biosynthesis
MRITVVIPVINSGGAEHAMAIIANYWAAEGRTVNILTYDDGAEPPFYQLDARIRHLPLGLAVDSPGLVAAVRNNWRRWKLLRGAIRDSQPDVVVSFIDQTNVLTLLSVEGLGVPTLVSEQSDPHTFPIKPIWDYLRRLTYRRAAKIVLLSTRDAEYFAPRLRARIAVIPNPFPPPPATLETNTSDAATRPPLLIAVGRLHRDKGFDILLEAFSLLKDEHPQWRLIVLGEGEERGRLEALRDALQLGERVSFPGRVKDPYSFLARASLFVMPSRTEGFPLALCEALACGLPAVCTECAGGVRDIIEDTVNGVLVPKEDVPALARSLGRLMGDEVERRRLSARAPEVIERFSLNKVMGAWEQVLSEVVNVR